MAVVLCVIIFWRDLSNGVVVEFVVDVLTSHELWNAPAGADSEVKLRHVPLDDRLENGQR